MYPGFHHGDSQRDIVLIRGIRGLRDYNLSDFLIRSKDLNLLL